MRIHSKAIESSQLLYFLRLLLQCWSFMDIHSLSLLRDRISKKSKMCQSQLIQGKLILEEIGDFTMLMEMRSLKKTFKESTI